MNNCGTARQDDVIRMNVIRRVFTSFAVVRLVARDVSNIVVIVVRLLLLFR